MHCHFHCFYENHYLHYTISAPMTKINQHDTMGRKMSIFITLIKGLSLRIVCKKVFTICSLLNSMSLGTMLPWYQIHYPPQIMMNYNHLQLTNGSNVQPLRLTLLTKRNRNNIAIAYSCHGYHWPPERVRNAYEHFTIFFNFSKIYCTWEQNNT